MKTIRKIIREVLHKQLDIHNSTKRLAHEIVNYINNTIQMWPRIKDGGEWESDAIVDLPEGFTKNTKIKKIKFNLNYTFSKENKISGNFRPDKTILLNNDYEVFISINAHIENDINEHKEKLEYIIAHELNHAFKFLKTIGKNTKTSILNKTKNLISKQLENLIKENIPLQEFMKMFYLSLQQEVDARTQETAMILNNIEKSNYDETIETLRKYQPLRDAKLMIDFNINKILQLEQNTLNLFIQTFNNNIKLFSEKQNIKIINDSNKFFKYWGNIINEKGNELFKKIMKLVADKHNVNEGVLLTEMDQTLLYKISGYDFNQCHK